MLTIAEDKLRNKIIAQTHKMIPILDEYIQFEDDVISTIGPIERCRLFIAIFGNSHICVCGHVLDNRKTAEIKELYSQALIIRNAYDENGKSFNSAFFNQYAKNINL